MPLSQQNTLKDALRNAMAQGYFVAIGKAIEQYPEAANFKLNNSINENILQSFIRKKRPEASIIVQHASLDAFFHHDQYGETALSLAITNDDLNIVNIIVKKGKSSLNKMEPQQSSLLTLAAGSEQAAGLDIFKILIKAGLHPDSLHPSEHTAHVLTNNIYLNLMLEKGWSFHGQHPQTKAAWAAYINDDVHEKIRDEIIIKTTQEEWQSMAQHTQIGNSMSALMYLLCTRKSKVVKEVMEKVYSKVGADNANSKGNLALHYALQFAPVMCMEQKRIQKEKNLEQIVQWYGEYILHPIARQTGNNQILKFGNTLEDFAEKADRELSLSQKSILFQATMRGIKNKTMDTLYKAVEESTPAFGPKLKRTKI